MTVHVPLILSPKSTTDDRSKRHIPSMTEKIEYSCVDTPDTVCVSRTLPAFAPFLEIGSARWYVNVNGGSPMSVNTISAWSPVITYCLSTSKNWLYV